MQQLSLEEGRRLHTRLAGVFLFWPLLAQLRLDRIVDRADYPGSKMVPAVQALMSLLTLKLLDPASPPAQLKVPDVAVKSVVLHFY